MSPLWHTDATLNLQQNEKPSPTNNSSIYSLAQDMNPLDGIKNISNIIHIMKRCVRKGISVLISIAGKDRIRRKGLTASMTVEAAVILPLFLFFFLNITSSIEMMRLHFNLEMALKETGRRLGIYGYAYKNLKDGIQNSDETEENSLLNFTEGILLSELYVKEEIKKYLGQQYLNSSPLSYGPDGLNFLEASFMEENDCIDLKLTYKVSLWDGLPGFMSFRMANRYYGRAWTGYEIPIEKEDISETYVYITETGEVYHKSPDCSYLKLKIKSVTLQEALLLQNSAGVHYTLCYLCRDENQQLNVYITSDGKRYHYTSNCAGLKRTIYMIKLSEAEGYRACSRCAR